MALIVRQREQADQQRRVAVGRELITAAEDLRDNDQRLSLLSSLRGPELAFTPEARAGS
ncbi:hypothetical protein ACWEV3_25935 [Saccharopolyspora sp. NPDC003752]